MYTKERSQQTFKIRNNRYEMAKSQSYHNYPEMKLYFEMVKSAQNGIWCGKCGPQFYGINLLFHYIKPSSKNAFKDKCEEWWCHLSITSIMYCIYKLPQTTGHAHAFIANLQLTTCAVMHITQVNVRNWDSQKWSPQ